MALGDYLQDRRKEALLRTVLLIIVCVVGWIIFQKLFLLSAATKMNNGAAAQLKADWEEMDRQYRGASRQYAFYLKIFHTLPSFLALEKIPQVEANRQTAEAGVQKVIAHYQAVTKKNQAIEKQKEKIRQEYLQRLKNGEIDADGEEIAAETPEDAPEATSAQPESRPAVPATAAKTPAVVEENQGKWWGEIKTFEDSEKTPSSQEEKMTVEKDEGVVAGNKPNWFNKK